MIKQLAKLLTPLAAIAAVVLLEMKAMSLGMNGVLLAGSVAAIAGLGGYQAKKVKDLSKKVK